jgi:hypothetical protein
MRESRFVFARAATISEFQKRRGRQALFKTGPFPLRVRFPPNASDMQAPGLPPRPGADIFTACRTNRPVRSGPAARLAEF